MALGALGVAVGCAVALLWRPEGLSPQGVCSLGILLGAIVWWVTGVLPEMVTAFVMVVLFIAVAGVPTETVLASFAGETWWLLFAAFGLGVGMKESGLVMRIAHVV